MRSSLLLRWFLLRGHHCDLLRKLAPPANRFAAAIQRALALVWRWRILLWSLWRLLRWSLRTMRTTSRWSRWLRGPPWLCHGAIPIPKHINSLMTRVTRFVVRRKITVFGRTAVRQQQHTLCQSRQNIILTGATSGAGSRSHAEARNRHSKKEVRSILN
jgi:hypothetical protein